MKLVCWGQSAAGRGKDQNEDSLVMDPEIGFFLVADGTGNSKNGQIAANTVADVMHTRVRGWLSDRILKRDADEARNRLMNRLPPTLNDLSEKIYRRAQKEPSCRGIATTASFIQVCGAFAVIGHVGDSRVYLCRDGKTYQVTEDHTLAHQLVKSGQLDRKQVSNHPHRKVLSRSLGHNPTVEADLMVVDVLPRDFFVLCSDGLSDVMRGREIARTVTSHPPEEAAPALIREAKERGSKDDITVIVFEVSGEAVRADSLRTEQKASLLGRIFLFQELSFQELLRVLAVVHEVRVAAGTEVIRQDDDGDTVFFIADGQAEVRRNGVLLHRLDAGDFCGELALLGDGVRTATVTTTRPSVLLTLSQSEFFQLVQSDHGLAIKLLWGFLQNLATRVKRATDEVADLRRR